MRNNIKLKGHEGSNCHVVVANGVIRFYSYNTEVITIKRINEKRYVKCTGTYSTTTTRQITYFLKEYAPDLALSDMKKIAGKGEVNI